MNSEWIWAQRVGYCFVFAMHLHYGLLAFLSLHNFALRSMNKTIQATNLDTEKKLDTEEWKCDNLWTRQ